MTIAQEIIEVGNIEAMVILPSNYLTFCSNERFDALTYTLHPSARLTAHQMPRITGDLVILRRRCLLLPAERQPSKEDPVDLGRLLHMLQI